MNPLVENIYRKAWKETTHHHATMQRFAELVVREVFVKIEDKRFEVYQPVKESVMKHFGVE